MKNEEIRYKTPTEFWKVSARPSSSLPLPGDWILISSITQFTEKRYLARCSTIKRPRVATVMIEKASRKLSKWRSTAKLKFISGAC